MTEASSEMVIANLIEAIEIAMGRKPSVKTVLRGGKPCQIEVLEYNAMAAIKGCELLGKHLRMFDSHHEINISRSEAALRAEFQAALQELRTLEGDDFVDALIEGRSVNN